MLSWLFILEVNANGNRLNIKQITKFLFLYILPTVISVVVVSNINENINLFIKEASINLFVINSFYIGLIHFYVQKKFFENLNSDVIIKFVPDKADVYIVLRLFMIFTKTYLPVIVPSILTFGMFVGNSKTVYYICSIIAVIYFIIVNVLIAAYLRYFTNTAKSIYIKMFNTIVGFYMFFLLIVLSIYSPISIMSNLEISLKQEIVRSVIEINTPIILIFVIITGLTLIILKDSTDFLKIKTRALIFNRSVEISKYSDKITNRIVDYYRKVYSKNLLHIENEIFNKDIKEIIRKNKFSFYFVNILHIIYIAIPLYFYFVEKSNSIETNIFMSKLVTAIIIGQLVFLAIINRAFDNHVSIENDLDVLNNYNITFTKTRLVRAKSRVLSVIVFPKIYSVFTVLIVSSIIRFNTYLSLIYLLSAIQTMFIRKTIELWRVKSINKLNSKSELIRIINILILFIVIVSFYSVYKNDYTVHLQGQIFLMIISGLMYVFHLTVNKLRAEKRREVEKC
ncbi:MAG: hypothetical protein GX660_16275 [Clostridiaceae bacterium]|nr:hypothetical protein [Clostridiaceae bacterium]